VVMKNSFPGFSNELKSNKNYSIKSSLWVCIDRRYPFFSQSSKQ
jgi:hypothetical protein